jgi:5-methylcytosine-specific restriction enzyme subunit McrC
MQILPISEGYNNKIEVSQLNADHALALRKKHPNKVEVVQDVADKEHFQIRSKGYIGYLVVSRDFGLQIVPKVQIANIFKMIEYANRIESVEFLKGQVKIDKLDDLAEGLASILAILVLNRARKGLYANYIDEKALLPLVRGRIDVGSTIRASQWPSTSLCCKYEEHTVDIEDNRILLWTLYCLRRLYFQREGFHQPVRRAYQALKGSVTLEQKEAKDCVDRSYDRLNDDYKSMHMLCSFFLENLSPGLMAGKRAFLPFTLYMPQLFESFVREWLIKYCPQNIIAQPWIEPVKATEPLTLKMDIVLRDASSKEVIAVIDTKYKTDDSGSSASSPSNEDIYQILTYSHQMSCPKAILVYPSGTSECFEAQMQDISVQSVVFDISQDDLGGTKFSKDLARALET